MIVVRALFVLIKILLRSVRSYALSVFENLHPYFYVNVIVVFF